MNIAGIPALRGFIFQKKVFIYVVLSELNHTTDIEFESIRDDVAVKNIKTSIFSIEGIKDKNIQVKSGTITKNIIYNIFTNWMLQTFNKEITYILISEKDPPEISISDVNYFYKKTQEALQKIQIQI